MSEEKLAELQNLPSAELAEQLGELSADELAALKALEAAASEPRADAMAAIDAAIAAKHGEKDDSQGGGEGPEDGGAKSPPSTVSARSGKARAETPDWQQPDYAGPLDMARMEWRRRNIKPVADVATKADKPKGRGK